MKREHALRIGLGLAAALAALLASLALLTLATRWVDVSASDAAVALSIIFGVQRIHSVLVVAGAALLAGALALLLLRGSVVFWKRAIVRAAFFGLVIALCVFGGTTLGWLATTTDWRDQVAGTRWWLTDRTPPVITLTAPQSPVRGAAAIGLAVSDDGSHSITRVTVDGQSLNPAALVALDTSTLADGEHTIVVEAADDSRQRNSAQASAVFRSETQWWMNDVTPPTISLTVPVTTVRGIAVLSLTTSDQGEHHVVRFTLDGMTLPMAALVNVDTTNLPDGTHTVVVEAEDASRQRNKVLTTSVFRSDNNAPTVTVRFDPAVATQGHTQFIHVTTSEPLASITATLGADVLTLARNGDAYFAVRGFEADAKTGSSPVVVRAVDMAGLTAQITATQAITRFTFPVENIAGENIALPPDRAALLDYGPSETAYLDTVFAPISAEQLWQGAFATPVRGVQTSPFAIRRSYNGGALGSYHGGVDIAANQGVPVAAANRGRVILAEALHVRGQSVCLDHGLGVYTCYYHLSQIKVQKGQMVDKNQVIGLVGSEGVSTGPHLHWEMRVTGKAVDPWPWTTRAYP